MKLATLPGFTLQSHQIWGTVGGGSHYPFVNCAGESLVTHLWPYRLLEEFTVSQRHGQSGFKWKAVEVNSPIQTICFAQFLPSVFIFLITTFSIHPSLHFSFTTNPVFSSRGHSGSVHSSQRRRKNAKDEEEVEDCLTHEMAREGVLQTLMVSTETRHH